MLDDRFFETVKRIIDYADKDGCVDIRNLERLLYPLPRAELACYLAKKGYEKDKTDNNLYSINSF